MIVPFHLQLCFAQCYGSRASSYDVPALVHMSFPPPSMCDGLVDRPEQSETGEVMGIMGLSPVQQGTLRSKYTQLRRS